MQTVVAPRYVARFSCIGSACEDTCCSGWNVTVDRDAFRRMRRALDASTAERVSFGSAVTRLRSRTSTRKRFALLVLQPETKACSFLDAQSLCGLQRRFGEAVLPDVCASFPRRQSAVRDRVETSLSLACPEAARQALLPRDALELVDLDHGALGRDHRVQTWRGDGDYEHALDVVRQAFLGILAGPGSLALRLASMVTLAEDLGPGFAKGRAIDSARAEVVLEELDHPARPARVARALATNDVPMERSLLSLLRILARRSTYPDERFDQLMQGAVQAYGIADDARIGDVAMAFAGRRDASAPHVGTRLDEILANYAMNHVFSSWFTAAPSLGVWTRGLVLRIALIRFFVFAHPSLASAESIDGIAVEVVSRMSRCVEHHAPFLAWLDTALPLTLVEGVHELGLLGL